MALPAAMDMEPQPEERRVMFSFFEKQVLLELIQKHKCIVESKDFNKIAWAKKNEAFQNIEKEFNQVPGVMYRTAQQLRQCYFNLKKRMTKQANRAARLAQRNGGVVPFQVEMNAPRNLEEYVSSQNSCSFMEIKKAFMAAKLPIKSADDTSTDDCQSMNASSPMVYVASADAIEPLVELIEQSENLQPNSHSTSTSITATPSSPTHETAEPPPPPRPTRAPSQRKAAVKAAKTLVGEKMKINLDRLKQERDEKEHSLRVKLLESQIAVQQKILEVLMTNPSSLNLVLNEH